MPAGAMSLTDLASLAAAQPVLVWGSALVVSLALLIRSADVLTDAAETIGRGFGLAPFVIGVTIVAFGTSLPELVSSVLAVVRGASEIVMGNVIGSNIANLGLVLAIAAVVEGRMRVQRPLAYIDLPFLAGATLLGAFVALSGTVDRLESLLLLGALAIYLHLCVQAPDGERTDEPQSEPRAGLAWSAIVLAVAAGCIYLGAEGTVRSILALARAYAVTTEALAVTVVAIGTSLPEVAVTALAARRGRGELAVGNIVGSNVFNILAVAGIAGLVGPLAVPATLLHLALPVMLGTTLLAVVMLQMQVLTRWEGLLLLLIYAWFLLAVAGLVR